MQILNHKDHGLRHFAQRVEQSCECGGCALLLAECRRNASSNCLSHVVQRSEHGRRQQRIAVTAQEPRPSDIAPAEGIDDCGLADPGFTRKQYDTAGPREAPPQRCIENRQLLLSFEKHFLHRCLPPQI